MDKPTLRQWGRQQRRGIDPAARGIAAQAMVARVLALPELATPTGVLAYTAVGAEVPTAALLAALHAAGHRVALPQIDDARAGDMHAVLVRAGDALVEGPCGVPAPGPGPALENPAVVLVPGVVFCPDTGARLGQGGGFYDRFLARHPQALAVGLAFDAQCSPGAAALAQPHDRGMHALVSESAIRWFGRPGKGDHAAPCEADGA